MKRDRALLTVTGLVAGLVAAIVSGRDWYRVTGHGFTGGELTDHASRTLPLAAMAGVGVTLLLGVWGRRVAGLLVAALGAGLVAVSASRHAPSAEQLENAVGSAMAAGSPTHAHLVSLAAGILLALVGLGFVLRAGTWRPPTTRFERSAPRDDQVSTSLDAWKAMDAGADPTE